MYSDVIIDFLIQNHYGCVKFHSNKNKLKKIIKNISGETPLVIIRYTTDDKMVTQNFMGDTKNIVILTSYEFVEDLDENFSKFSTIFIDDFQKADFFTLSIMNEWYSRYHREDQRLPYLLLGSIVVSYQKIPLPLNIEKVLDLSSSLEGEEDKIIVQHSRDNYNIGCDELYQKLVEIVVEEVQEYKKGERAVLYLPNEQKINQVADQLESLLTSNIIIIRFLPHLKIVTPYRETGDSIMLILSTDYTRTGIYFPNIKTVFDSGETMRTYTTRTGGQSTFLKKIDREEMELRKGCHTPEKYLIMVPSVSVKNLRKNTIPISYRINLPPHILHLLRNDITDLTFFYQEPTKKALENLKITKNITTDLKVTDIGLYSCMLYEEGFDFNIYHSTFLYHLHTSPQSDEYMFPGIVIVSLFQNQIIRNDKTFKDIFYELTRECSPLGEVEECDSEESHSSTIKMIDELCEVLEVTKTIYNPSKIWKRMMPMIEKVYHHQLCRYEGGKYINGKGDRIKIVGKRIPGNISKIILPISVFQNERGEYFTDFFVPMKALN